MSVGKFERKKSHVNVGTIGHVSRDKRTLVSALQFALKHSPNWCFHCKTKHDALTTPCAPVDEEQKEKE